MKYLQHPNELAALPKEEAWLLGLFREGTYDEYYRKALEAGFPTPRLIVTKPTGRLPADDTTRLRFRWRDPCVVGGQPLQRSPQ